MNSSIDHPFATSDKRAKVKIRMGAGQAGLTPKTVVDSFNDVVSKFGDKPSLHQKIRVEGMGMQETPWTTWTWKEYREKVDAFAKSLLTFDFQKHDIVNIIGFNSPEWFFADFGTIVAGGIPAGIYATNGPDSCMYISEHSKAKVVVCEGLHQLQKYSEISSQLTELKALVVYGVYSVPEDAMEKFSVPVYTFSDFLKIGADVPDEELVRIAKEMTPNEICTLIYTSGTTGPPKAAMITHDNITWSASTMPLTLSREIGPEDHFISYLPLSHIAAQVLDMHLAMATGHQVWFAQPDALRGSLGKTLKDVRPTIFFGVPRVWEKIYDKMQEVRKSSGYVTRTIGAWAKSKASLYHESHQYGGDMITPWSLPLARKILGRIRVALGLDRCLVCFVGAAPVDIKILKYFASIDLPIMECFGQSESSGAHSMNDWNAYKFGSVGRPQQGTITKIDEVTGELMYSGRHIFAGYMDMEQKTIDSFDHNGFLHSGDIATIDECNRDNVDGPSGFVRITGRIKELIITAGGENIPPVPIEEHVKSAIPEVCSCIVIGDKRKFLSMLLCLHATINSDDGMPMRQLTGISLDTSIAIGSSARTTDEAANCEKWRKYINDGIAIANSKATSRAQKIAKWAMLPTSFSEKTGELTPTLKLKRDVILNIHAEVIESMYCQ